MRLNKEIFYLIWDSEGLRHASSEARTNGVTFGQTQLWVRSRNGKQKTTYTSKMLRQERQLAVCRI